jgi:hypothetical protein
MIWEIPLFLILPTFAARQVAQQRDQLLDMDVMEGWNG